MIELHLADRVEATASREPRDVRGRHTHQDGMFGTDRVAQDLERIGLRGFAEEAVVDRVDAAREPVYTGSMRKFIETYLPRAALVGSSLAIGGFIHAALRLLPALADLAACLIGYRTVAIWNRARQRA